MKIVGRFEAWHRRGRRLLGHGVTENDVLEVAKAYMADVLRGADEALGVMAIGTSGTAVDGLTQVALLAEIARVALPAPGTDTGTARNVRSGTSVYFRASFTGLTATIREVALVGGIASPPGAIGSGRYWDRALVGPYSITSGETLTLEGTLIFG